MLGALLAGKTYVPLHPEFPAARTEAMRKRAGVRLLIVGLEALDALSSMLPTVSESLTILLPNMADPPSWAYCLYSRNGVLHIFAHRAS